MHMIGKDLTICEEGPFPSFTFFFVHFDYWSIKRKKTSRGDELLFVTGQKDLGCVGRSWLKILSHQGNL